MRHFGIAVRKRRPRRSAPRDALGFPSIIKYASKAALDIPVGPRDKAGARGCPLALGGDAFRLPNRRAVRVSRHAMAAFAQIDRAKGRVA